MNSFRVLSLLSARTFHVQIKLIHVEKCENTGSERTSLCSNLASCYATQRYRDAITYTVLAQPTLADFEKNRIDKWRAVYRFVSDMGSEAFPRIKTPFMFDYVLRFCSLAHSRISCCLATNALSSIFTPLPMVVRLISTYKRKKWNSPVHTPLPQHITSVESKL